jgi:hypothetical protein
MTAQKRHVEPHFIAMWVVAHLLGFCLGDDQNRREFAASRIFLA